MATDGLRHLQIFPVSLDFQVEAGRDAVLALSLYNPGAASVGFKLKTTNTQRFRVRPNFGEVGPGETTHVKVGQIHAPCFLAAC
jgi:MSP (Major sperm protein) domain